MRRKLLRAQRRWREAQMFVRAMASPHHPVLAQIVPIRRCNLACTYCNEFDRHSQPVPTGEMLRRIDKLAELGTSIITFSGGEPTLHPDLDILIRRARDKGAIATVITNGYFLVPERIRRLNAAGLDYLQISIDNVQPDEVSKKSLKVLDQKLTWLAEHAEFDVTINSVLGSEIRQPEDAYTIASRARQLGFNSTIGILHDGSGQLAPLQGRQRSVYDRFWAWVRGCSRLRISTPSNRTQSEDCRTRGIVRRAADSCISAKRGSCTIVRSSGVRPPSRSLITAGRI